MIKFLKDRIINTGYLSVTLFLVFTTMIFSPFVMYVTNVDELWFSMSSFLPTLLLWSIIILLVFLGILSIMPGNISDFVSVILFSISLCTYIQGQILKNDYGTLDGHEIDWGQYGRTAILNTLFWMVVIVAFIVIYLFFRDKVINILKIAATLLIMYEALIGIMLLVDYRDVLFSRDDSDELHLTTEGLYDISKNKNVIVFCLDEFDSVTFLEMHDEYPEVDYIMEGFRYYPDTVGATGRTKYAIPYLMSGQLYTDPVSYKEYRDASIKKSPIFGAIKDIGVNSGVYSCEDYVGKTVPEVINNLKKIEDGVTSKTLLSCDMLKISCFRSFPHLLKKYVWIYTGDFNKYRSNDVYNDSDDVAYYDKLKEYGLNAVKADTCFRFIHLQGDHGPYVMDENGNEAQSDRIRQARGCFTILQEYFEQLKMKDLYDDAYIVVLSDHGRDSSMTENSANPIFFVKPSGSGVDKLQFSDKPMYYSIYQEMICDALNGTANSSMYPDEVYNIPKQRFYYHQSDLSQGVEEYEIVGKAYDKPQVLKTGVHYYGNNTLADEYPKYEFGTVLDFTEEMTGFSYIKDSNVSAEIVHTALLGESTTFRFKINNDYEFVRAYILMYAPDRMVRFTANGYEVYNAIPNESLVTVDIPREYVKDGKLELVMEHKDGSIPIFQMYINPLLEY